METNLKRIPRDAIQRWKQFVEDIKKGTFLDNLKAHQLKFVLSKIPVRVLKYTKERIIGQGNIVVGCIRELEQKIHRIPREALTQWKKYVAQVKNGAFIDALRA